MKTCPVCFNEIHDDAIKCPHCLSFIKPRINEGQFWGTGLMVGGILIGILSYIWFLAEADNLRLQFMNVGIYLAYFGFLVYGFGTFRSWFRVGKLEKEPEKLEQGKKRCFYCGSIISERAIKCKYCLSFLRQERGKILATFIVVSGILIMTTAYILYLAQRIRSEFYMQVGYVIILAGILMFLLLVLKRRYSGTYH